MSDWALGKKLNSQIADVPLNHLIWLNDYKTYGENSYVFQNKDILHELYRSPIAANDEQIFSEANEYNKENLPANKYLSWYKCMYQTDRNDDEILYYYKGFANLSDVELAQAIEKHYNSEIDVRKCFSIGDARKVSVGAISANGVNESHRAQNIEMVIAGFDHDDLETPINGHNKAAISLIQKDCFMSEEVESSETGKVANSEDGNLNSSNTTSGGWEECSRRKWCNEVLYSAIEKTFRDAIKPVKKKYVLTASGNAGTIATCVDKISVPSMYELLGDTASSTIPISDGEQYEYYKNNSALKLPNHYNASNGVLSSGAWYWTRSCYNNLISYFYLMGSSGLGVSYPTIAQSITVEFCI